MKITIECKPKEIADLAQKLQNRQNKSNYTEYLEKQLKRLSECSEYAAGGDTAKLSLAMIKIIRALQS